MYLRARIVIISVASLLLLPAEVRAQEVESAPDTLILPVWDIALIGKLAASQAAYRNWTGGGINTLASTSSIDGTFSRTSADWQQKHETRLAFGIVKQDTVALRKADDLIRLHSSLQYRGNGFFATFNPIFALSARTQFAPGFNYERNPFRDGRAPPVKVSDLFSPATFTQSMGLTYDPNTWFTQRLSLAAKETVVLSEFLRTLYNLDEGQPVRLEMGLESRTQVDREVAKNVRLKSTLGLFAAFNQPEVPDVLWENLIAMKINTWLSVNVEVVALFDRDLSEALQIREVMSLGISYNFF
jgi:hypothetical protein